LDKDCAKKSTRNTTVQQNQQDIRKRDILYDQDRKRLNQSLLQNWMTLKKHHKENCSQYK